MTLLSTLLGITAALSQSLTNGQSRIGTLEAPKLPDFLSNNPLPLGFPWAGGTVGNTNPYQNAPVTGVVRNYDFTISRAALSPDGFQKSMILVNGQYPGPTIEANWGDTIQVTVRNNIQSPAEGTAMHWHGFLQKNSQWNDGVPGVSQCPIVPGGSETYRFQADLYGTTWYHTHFASQYADGAIGPIVIHGPKNAKYDVDLGPVMLNDYYHSDYVSILKYVLAPQGPPPVPTSDNNLINGKGVFDCSTAPTGSTCQSNAGLAKFNFQSGRKHLLRLINSGAEAAQQFRIDGHQMIVVANDLVPVTPYNTSVVTLGIGQRTDIIVQGLANSTGAFWMRSNATCSTSLNPQALAVVYYEKANTSSVPTSQPAAYTPGCDNDQLATTVPFFPIPAKQPTTTLNLDLTVAHNASNQWVWSVNNKTYRADWNNPELLLAKQGNLSFLSIPSLNSYSVGTNSTYRIIFNNLTPVPHPMHFHGHNMQILNVGVGTWDGSTIVNPSNPQRRDAQMVPPFGYLVWQTDADNAGTWPFHCHIAWHLSGGLSVDLIENPAAVARLPIPSTQYQQCRDWSAYSGKGLAPEIDSGV